MRHDELRPDDPGQEPDDGLRSPAMPMTPLDSASCTSPASAPASIPVTAPDVSAM